MSKTGVIILTHGSRSKQTINEILNIFDRVTDRVRSLLAPGVEVLWAALQFNHPNLEEAVEALVARGIDRVLILPYFLLPGRHITEEMPLLIETLRQTYPETQFVMADTLGVNEHLIDLVITNIKKAVPEIVPDLSLPPAEPQVIEKRSMEIVERLLPSLGYSENEKAVVKRIVHSVGDRHIASLVRFHPQAISAGIAAIRAGKPIFADVKMVAVGINRRLADGYGCSVRCVIDDPEVARRSQLEGITRSAASVRHLGKELNGAIVAIGNAPTALLALLDLIDKGDIAPALVVGMPVGFVAARESKDELMKRNIPYIAIEGNRGGSTI
ncbi:MAG: precorrin-8X methylmutase, partial [Chloroflexota bacterium]|nr:precorrin-8X methylmutase [Chloroflexota bacterium]